LGKIEINTGEEYSTEEKLDIVIESLEKRVPENIGNDSDDDNGDIVIPEDELTIDAKSHLGETLNFLKDFRERYKNDDHIEDEKRNVDGFCEDYLKPALLVDGQHRTFGAYNKISEEWEKGNDDFEIFLPVGAIINSDWKESVFQFVVINQTAKNIDSKFLSSIISTSLTDLELGHFRKQLMNSGVQVTEGVVLNELGSTELEIQGDNINPFYRNIEFGIDGQVGDELRYNTVKDLVNKLRYFKDSSPTNAVFRRPYGDLKNLIEGDLQINTENWQEKYWVHFIIYFWYLAKNRFNSQNELKYRPYGRSGGSYLCLKVCMQYIQDHFVHYITKHKILLKKSNLQLEIQNEMLDFYSFKGLFDQWCIVHDKDSSFFETEWKGFSSFRRGSEKYEAIHNAWEVDQYRRAKLFRG